MLPYQAIQVHRDKVLAPILSLTSQYTWTEHDVASVMPGCFSFPQLQDYWGAYSWTWTTNLHVKDKHTNHFVT